MFNAKTGSLNFLTSKRLRCKLIIFIDTSFSFQLCQFFLHLHPPLIHFLSNIELYHASLLQCNNSLAIASYRLLAFSHPSLDLLFSPQMPHFHFEDYYRILLSLCTASSPPLILLFLFIFSLCSSLIAVFVWLTLLGLSHRYKP